MRHNIVDKLTNMAKSPALHSSPDPAGLLVSGRDWELQTVPLAAHLVSTLGIGPVLGGLLVPVDLSHSYLVHVERQLVHILHHFHGHDHNLEVLGFA